MLILYHSCVMIGFYSYVWYNRFTQVLDLTQGLRYLHELGIVHGDLKGVIRALISELHFLNCMQINALVDRSGRACLADFGLSSVSAAKIPGWTTLLTSMANSGGTLRWQAPELLEDQPSTFASDIYAWSCVCYEVISFL